MNVTITARHCEIPQSLRTATERRIERLTRYNPRLAEAEVTYDRARVSHECEIRLAIVGEPPLVARATGQNFRVALDRGLDRASRQLIRSRQRRIAPRAEAVP